MGAWAAWAVLLMLAGLVGGQGRDTRPLIRPPPEVVGPEGMEEAIPDEAFFVDTVRRNELSESETPAVDERLAVLPEKKGSSKAPQEATQEAA